MGNMSPPGRLRKMADPVQMKRVLGPGAGFEPARPRLAAECSATELPRSDLAHVRSITCITVQSVRPCEITHRSPPGPSFRPTPAKAGGEPESSILRGLFFTTKGTHHHMVQA